MGFCPNIRLNNAPLLSRALVQAKHDKKGLTWLTSSSPLEEGLKVRGLEDVRGRIVQISLAARIAPGSEMVLTTKGPGEFVNGLPA